MPPSVKKQTQLLRDLQENNVFFDDVVNMIPAKLYIAGNSGDDKDYSSQHSSKYYKGQHKESKEAKRARNKAAKRRKFDPDLAETTTQTKERLMKEQEQDSVETTTTTKQQSKKQSNHSSPSPADNNHNNQESSSSSSSNHKSRIEALREKLQAKLAEQRAKRPTTTDPNAVSKRAARRAEKQKRMEEAKAKKRKSSSSKAEANAKTKQYKMASNATPQQDLANLDFGALAGLNATPKNYANNKSLANVNKKKNLQKLLADAEAKQKQLDELKRSESQADKDKAQTMVWSDALKEASGNKDTKKSNPAKLKKAMKHRAAKKQKSAKAWASRMKQTKQKMDERQKIRRHNLDKRKKGGAVGANLSKKRIVVDTNDAGVEIGKDGKPKGFEGNKKAYFEGENNTKKKSKKKKKGKKGMAQ